LLRVAVRLLLGWLLVAVLRRLLVRLLLRIAVLRRRLLLVRLLLRIAVRLLLGWLTINGLLVSTP